MCRKINVGENKSKLVLFGQIDQEFVKEMEIIIAIELFKVMVKYFRLEIKQ